MRAATGFVLRGDLKGTYGQVFCKALAALPGFSRTLQWHIQDSPVLSMYHPGHIPYSPRAHPVLSQASPWAHPVFPMSHPGRQCKLQFTIREGYGRAGGGHRVLVDYTGMIREWAAGKNQKIFLGTEIEIFENKVYMLSK